MEVSLETSNNKNEIGNMQFSARNNISFSWKTVAAFSQHHASNTNTNNYDDVVGRCWSGNIESGVNAGSPQEVTAEDSIFLTNVPGNIFNL